MTDKHKEERVEKGPDMSSGFATSHTPKDEVEAQAKEHRERVEAAAAEAAEDAKADEKAEDKE